MPTVGWHIDPFGHTSTQAVLFAKMGFNMFVFGRAPDDVLHFGRQYTDQFLWRPSTSLPAAETDLWTYFHAGYGGHSPCKQNCSLQTLQSFAKEMHFAVHNFERHQTPHVMFMIGGDFFDPDYSVIDPLVKGIQAHPELNVNISYSTPSRFYQDIHEYTVAHHLDWNVFKPPNNE